MAGVTTFRKHEWLSQEIRREILEQKIPVGQKLLTDNELMEKYKISRSTVVHAMKTLREEGHVSRKVGAGTFVRDKTNTGEIAVVAEDRVLRMECTPIWHMTISGVVDVVREQNSQWRPKIHMVTLDPVNTGMIKNCDLLDPQVVPNLRGVFSMTPLRGGIAEKLTERGIPSVLYGSGIGPYHPNQIDFDIDQMNRLAFQHLAQTGCKTVGFLYEGPKQEHFAGRVQKVSTFFRENGLQCRPEWMVHYPSPAISEKGGYELFHKLWKQPVRPEGIFVDDDLQFRGVVRAAMELGVRFPEDIKVITISPIGVPLPYHKAVTVIGLDVHKLAKASVDMMEKLIRRIEPEKRHVLIPVELIKGDTT
ncbi:MAG: substrate-binding domain-containing protein [Phycisphaerae bacterium]